MSKIKILADSTCDLSPELIEQYDIGIVPLYVNLDGRILRDGIDATPDDIHESVQKNGVLPGTIAASVADFKDAFEKWRSEGYEVICSTISSDMSGTFQNAKIAADEAGGIWAVDSRNLSTGGGFVPLYAAQMAQSGMQPPEIVRRLNELTPKINASFILGDLDYMKKGGRCSSVMALGANLLKIRPEILVENGAMRVGHKYRGPLQKVLREYVSARLAGHTDIRTDRIFITHTGCAPELVDAVREEIGKHLHFDEILETHAGCTIFSHCGKDTLGILYVMK